MKILNFSRLQGLQENRHISVLRYPTYHWVLVIFKVGRIKFLSTFILDFDWWDHTYYNQWKLNLNQKLSQKHCKVFKTSFLFIYFFIYTCPRVDKTKPKSNFFFDVSFKAKLSKSSKKITAFFGLNLIPIK